MAPKFWILEHKIVLAEGVPAKEMCYIRVFSGLNFQVLTGTIRILSYIDRNMRA